MAVNYVNYKIASFDKINKDWAFWDPSYYFMGDKNEGYIEENLPGFIFENLNINSILFFDDSGSFFYGKYYNHNTGEFTEIPQVLVSSLLKQGSVNKPGLSNGESGLLNTGGRIYIVTINPVLKSDLSGPAKGTLVMVKQVSDEYIEEISNEININFELLTISDENPDVVFNPQEKSQKLSYSPNGTEIYINSVLYGINNKPAALIKVIGNRDLFKLGQDTVLYYSAFAIILCAVIIVMLNFVLDSLFVKRIESFSSELKRIAEKGDYSARLQDDNDDEISSISNSANILLQTIQSNINSLQMNNAELKKTLNEKSELIGELHHRVKNNLQYIISLLGLKSLKIKDEKALEVINEATNRIKYLGMIHDDLYNKEEKDSLLFKQHLSDLANIILDGTSKWKKDKIAVQIKGDEFEAELSLAIPLSTAMYELIRNSVDHAFDEKGGTIDIEITKADSNLMIAIKDDGRGMGKSDKGQFSFGINNARSIITKQLLGTIESTGTDTGTCWIIRLSLKPGEITDNTDGN